MYFMDRIVDLMSDVRGAPPPPAPYSKAHLTAWLEGQPADESYYWESCSRCLFGLYETSLGRRLPLGNSPSNVAMDAMTKMHGAPVMEFAVTQIAMAHPHTFGAALERLRNVEMA